MAFDNSTTTRCRSLGEVNAWLQIEFPKSIKITPLYLVYFYNIVSFINIVLN